MKNFFSILILCVFIFPRTTNAQSLRDSLNQSVAALQQTPNDNALKEKIISLSLRIKPAPAIPDNANEKLVMGTTFREGKEYELAIKSLNEALLITPWWGEAYKELGLTLEFAEKFDETIAAFQLYLKTNPGEEMAMNTKNEIAKVKAKKEIAEKKKVEAETNSPEALARKDKALVKSLDGALFSLLWVADAEEIQILIEGDYIKVQQKRLASRVCLCGDNCVGPIGQVIVCQIFSLNGRIAIDPPKPEIQQEGGKYTIAPDGNSITWVWLYYNGEEDSRMTYTFKRQ
jgi:tetratricopeptide (TPR) repeat protein